MHKQFSLKVDPKLLAGAPESPADRIWCGVCGTDEFILIEHAAWRRHSGRGGWDIDYTCTNCDSVYGHAVRDADATPALLAAMAAARNEAAQDPAKEP